MAKAKVKTDAQAKADRYDGYEEQGMIALEANNDWQTRDNRIQALNLARGIHPAGMTAEELITDAALIEGFINGNQ